MSKIFSRIDPALRRIYLYFLPYKWRLVLAGLFLMASASMSSVTATLLGKLTDLGFYGDKEWVIYAAPAGLLGVTLIYTVSTVMSSYIMAKVSQGVLIKLRTQLFDNMMRWPAQEYQARTTGEASSKFVNEAGMALGDAASAIITMVRESVQVLGLLVVLFWHNWQLTFVTFLVAPGLAFVLRYVAKRMRVIVKKSQEAIASMITRVQESYEAERVVKISDTYAFEEVRFEKVNQSICRLALKSIRMTSIQTPVTQVLTMVAVAFVVAVALMQAQQGTLTIGEFVTFLAAMLMLKEPIQNLANLNSTFTSISVASRSIFSMVDAPHEQDGGKVELADVRGDVVFDHVGLVYPGQTQEALKDFCLHVRSGEHVALVGQSGSGKSSCVNLIARFWECTSGRVLIDGVPVRDCTLKSLRKHIAIVEQNPVMLDGTIRENITYGMPDATPEQIERAVEIAGLTEFVKAAPKGVDTPVGENGKMLSGGQRQRVAIARAILKDAPIIIFDEATSALDSKTEKQIKDSMNRLVRGRTCIAVAHRFSSIEHVDRVIVMSQGQIVEEGTIEELMQKDGVFKHLSDLQKVSSKTETTSELVD